MGTSILGKLFVWRLLYQAPICRFGTEGGSEGGCGWLSPFAFLFEIQTREAPSYEVLLLYN